MVLSVKSLLAAASFFSVESLLAGCQVFGVFGISDLLLDDNVKCNSNRTQN